jgi:thiamine biosynthesis lipoprotein
VDGTRYQHILDLRTGWPVREVTSTTVIAGNGTDADALATAMTVLGWERGLALVESLPDTEALAIDREGHVHVSRGQRLEGDRLHWRR